MKLFETYQKLMAFEIVRAKLKSSHSRIAANSNEVHLQLKTLLPFGSHIWGIVSASIFICFEAKTFAEYSQSFYSFAMTVSNLCSFLLHITCVGSKIFDLIDRFESTIEESEY